MDKNGDSHPSSSSSEAKFAAPIEMEFAPSGDLYILEYGTIWFRATTCSLVRIEYNAGNRKPIVQARWITQGALPRVALSSAGTVDLDEIRSVTNGRSRSAVLSWRVDGSSPSITLRHAGTYTAALTVTDARGASTSAAPIEIVAGNHRQRWVSISVAIPRSSSRVCWCATPAVTDREDGTLRSGRTRAPRALRAHISRMEWSGASLRSGAAVIEAGDCLSLPSAESQVDRTGDTATSREVPADRSASARSAKEDS